MVSVRAVDASPGADQEAIVQRAWTLIERMPAPTPPLPLRLEGLPDGYFCDGKQRIWNNLLVSRLVHKNLIKAIPQSALWTLRLKAGHGAGGEDYQLGLNEVGVFMDHISKTLLPGPSEPCWIIVEAYLWNFWQRARVFHCDFAILAAVNLNGITNELDRRMMQAHFHPMRGISLRQFSQHLSETLRLKNICSWILQLMYVSRGQTQCCASLGLCLWNSYHAVKPIRALEALTRAVIGRCFHKMIIVLHGTVYTDSITEQDQPSSLLGRRLHTVLSKVHQDTRQDTGEMSSRCSGNAAMRRETIGTLPKTSRLAGR